MTDAVIAAARGFGRELLSRAEEIEAGRRLPQDLAARFAAAGFYRLCVPEAYGGLECTPLVLSQVIETLAAADGAAGWCVMIGATTGLTAAYLAPEAAQAVFGDPGAIVAGVFAPRGTAVREGAHYRVTGRWQWGSGSPNARWIMGGAQIVADGKPVVLANGMPVSRMMIARAEEVTLIDTWDVAGLAGTGSQDFAFADLRIPAEMSVGLLSDTPLARPLYAFPVFGLLAAGVASVMLGLAEAAIAALVTLAGSKTPEGHRKPLASRSRTQEDVASAEAARRAARAFLHEALAAAFDAAQGGGAIPPVLRRDLRLAATHAARASVQAVDLMYAAGGGTSVYRTSPLQRIFRDTHVAAQHMMVAPPTMETAGRLLLGLETDMATF